MLLSHMYMLTDLGCRLRSEEANWRHPLVMASVFFLLCALSMLLSQIIVLSQKPDWDYPLWSTFIISICISIVSVSFIFTYTFMPLIYWKKNRKTVGYSRTTALGIWFFSLQNLCFICNLTLYIWFFIEKNWEYWQILLAFDYTLRYFQNLIYSWPPPAIVIDFLTDQLATTMIQCGSNRDRYNVNIVMNSEAYTNSGDVEMLQTFPKTKRTEFMNESSDSLYGRV
ncbi:hypothetical protein K501DRAFT_256283 [Backusella circina FSU 941]|nr:hypothetical protein K501DRAFT_256283 [Backusella circina FSU 941]